MEKETKRQKKKINKTIRTLKFNKIKTRIFFSILAISFILEVWLYYADCIKLVCEPAFLGITYYVFWVFQLLYVYLILILAPNQFFLYVIKILIYFLQIVYWYALTLVISYLTNHVRKHKGKKKRKKEKHLANFIKRGIERDIKEAEDLEKKKPIKRR